MTTVIRFTDEDLALATRLAKRAVMDQESDLTEREVRLGKLGEIAFIKHLQSKGHFSDYEHGVSRKIFETKSGETVEIRTASEVYYKRILVPAEQYEDYPKDYYVGVKILDNNRVVSIGYACWDEFELSNIVNDPTYVVYIKNLHCIDELLSKF